MEFKDLNTSKDSTGLVPAIIQDSRTLKVLMLGYMNEEAFDKTVSSGLVTFYSRDRGCIWTKGETSGNYLHVVEMFADCDSDTLLIKARPDGPTCHRGTVSCFDTPENEGFVRELADVVRRRREEMPNGSYTTKLFIKGTKAIAKKVGEETAEAVIEAVDGNRERFTYEACDLIYHFLVLLEQMGVSLGELEDELAARHR